MTKLDIDRVDLRSLGEALEDHSHETSWWLDPATGAVEPGLDDLGVYDLSDEEIDEFEGRELVRIEPLPSRRSYGDMEDFAARVRDRRARDLLQRAIAGRGAFRRFKDTLLEFPDLREAWFAFHDVGMRRRALDWLADEGLVERTAADAARDAAFDPELPQLGDSFDATAVSRDVADDLRALYGDRLQRIVLFGSWARGDADEESDLDLLVVLDDVRSTLTERERMSDLLWKRTIETGRLISAIVMSAEDYQHRETPFLNNVAREGRLVT